MSYAVVMVYVEPDEAREGRVRLAASLADKFGATLIGVSARAIPPPILADGVVSTPTAVDINLMKEQLAKQGSWFRNIADGDRQRRNGVRRSSFRPRRSRARHAVPISL